MKWIEVRLYEKTDLFKAFLQVIKKIPDKHESVMFTLPNKYLSEHYKKPINDVYRINCQYNEDNIGYDIFQQYIEAYE